MLTKFMHIKYLLYQGMCNLYPLLNLKADSAFREKYFNRRERNKLVDNHVGFRLRPDDGILAAILDSTQTRNYPKKEEIETF